MEFTLEELRCRALVEIKRRFKKFGVSTYCGAIVTSGTSYARIDLTDEELIDNQDRVERYIADRCDTAEVQITGNITNRS